MTIIYPAPLSDTATIGVTAPSSGIGKRRDRYQLVKRDLIAAGYRIIEGNYLFSNTRAVSGGAKERAEEFARFWLDPNIDFILPPWGGEQLIGILEYIDWDALAGSAPKWCMGYSDISLLLFVLTTKLRVASAHGTNLMEMTAVQEDALTVNALLPLKLQDNQHCSQNSADRYVKDYLCYGEHPSAAFNLTEQVQWKTLSGNSERIQGRAIGGCIDVLMHIIGTKFDSFNAFCEDQKESVVLYLENCELTSHTLMRALYQMKYAGWFEKVSGVVFGRNAGTPDKELPNEAILAELFSGTSIPVIYDGDIGHAQPNLTIINGALSEFFCDGNGKGLLTITRK